MEGHAFRTVFKQNKTNMFDVREAWVAWQKCCSNAIHAYVHPAEKWHSEKYEILV